jgi:predicted RNase H-like HicB family nuclease
MAGYSRSAKTGINMAKLIDVRFRLPGQIRQDKETDCFVAYCPALDLYSAGPTRPDAKRALQSAVDMFVRICFSRNILNVALRARGFELDAIGSPGIPAAGPEGPYIAVVETASGEKYDDVFSVEVPLHLVADRQAKQAEACLQ